MVGGIVTLGTLGGGPLMAGGIVALGTFGGGPLTAGGIVTLGTLGGGLPMAGGTNPAYRGPTSDNSASSGGWTRPAC
jgi:hypothetical protein